MTITQFLESLGNTSEEVAQSLINMGIKGERGNCKFCPIIKAVYQNFPDMGIGLKALFLECSSGYRKFGSYGYIYCSASTTFKLTWNDCQIMDPHCPEVIGKFVKDFDNGKYPELEGKTQSQIKKDLLNKLSVEEKMALGI